MIKIFVVGAEQVCSGVIVGGGRGTDDGGSSSGTGGSNIPAVVVAAAAAAARTVAANVPAVVVAATAFPRADATNGSIFPQQNPGSSIKLETLHTFDCCGKKSNNHHNREIFVRGKFLRDGIFCRVDSEPSIAINEYADPGQAHPLIFLVLNGKRSKLKQTVPILSDRSPLVYR